MVTSDMLQKTAFLAGIAFSLGIFTTAFVVQGGRERIEASRAAADYDCRYTMGLCYATGFNLDDSVQPDWVRLRAWIDAANADRRPKGPNWNHTHYWKPPAYSGS